MSGTAIGPRGHVLTRDGERTFTWDSELRVEFDGTAVASWSADSGKTGTIDLYRL